MCPTVTCRSSSHTYCVSSVKNSYSRMVNAPTNPAASSQGWLGRNRPLSSRRAIAPVSTYAASSYTTGFIGTCTMINQFPSSNRPGR